MPVAVTSNAPSVSPLKDSSSVKVSKKFSHKQSKVFIKLLPDFHYCLNCIRAVPILWVHVKLVVEEIFWITASGKSALNVTQYALSGFQARQRNASVTTARRARGIFSDNVRSRQNQRAGCRYLNVLAARGVLALAGGGWHRQTVERPQVLGDGSWTAEGPV